MILFRDIFHYHHNFIRRVVINKTGTKKEYRVNEEIRAKEVRLVGESDKPEIVPFDQAMEKARIKGLDLVEISPDQDPPVVKIADYSRLMFEQRKRVKDSKKKQKIVHVKELKFRPSIDSHDYQHKVKHARAFIENGDKVKFTVVFRGRQIVHADLGYKIMEDVKRDMGDIVTIEREPVMEGRNIIMITSPAASIAKKKKD